MRLFFAAGFDRVDGIELDVGRNTDMRTGSVSLWIGLDWI